MLHGDDAERTDVGIPPRTLGVFMAIDGTAILDTWPRKFFVDSPDRELTSVVYRSEVVHVRKGCIIHSRGGKIHREVENMSADNLDLRVHANLRLADEPISTEWRDKRYPAKQISD